MHTHAVVRATAARLRIHLRYLRYLRYLPTYAPWTNPIEKLWRWLKQTCLVHHHKADHWEELKADLAAFLDQFAAGSDALLRSVGLSPD